MTAAFESARFPNVIACVGHVCAQAGTTSPSRIGRSSFLASMRAALIRCTQYVHFSITPRLRTVTFGFRPSFRLSVVSSENFRKLKCRNLYGQLFKQYRVPIQRL